MHLSNLSIYLSIHPSIYLSIYLPRETTSQLPKAVRTWFVLYILTSKMCFAPQRRAFFRHHHFQKRSERRLFCTFWLRKCASRHNGVRIFDISTFKIGPGMVCFVHFDLETCFAPQRRALFRHPNFQKWSDVGVLCTFWLGNVLRATTACNFSSLIWAHGSAPAALASLLFDPPEPQILGKTRRFATFLPFRAPGSSFFWLFLFSDLLSSTLLFSDSSHICFSSASMEFYGPLWFTYPDASIIPFVVA